jgi:hypothetical protein
VSRKQWSALKQGPGSVQCKVSAGLGLGWQVIKHNQETIIDHDGSDWGMRTLVFYLAQRQLGVVIFTNGENGTKVIRKIVQILHPSPVFIATL